MRIQNSTYFMARGSMPLQVYSHRQILLLTALGQSKADRQHVVFLNLNYQSVSKREKG